MRPTSSPFANPSGLVDKRLGNMWAQIEEVRALLPQIAHVSYYLESLFNLDRNLTLLSDENVDHHILKDITIFQGANAYELALVEGFVGTPAEWLESLIGPIGSTGFLDVAAHQVLIDGIAANVAALAAADAAILANTNKFSDYTTLAAYNADVTAVQAQLTALETSILAQVDLLLPTPRTNAEIGSLAQAVVNTALAGLEPSFFDPDGRLDSIDLLLDGLRDDLDVNEIAFNEFVFSNLTTIGRITALEAVGEDTAASLIELQTVTFDTAAQQLVLTAESASQLSQINSLSAVSLNQATQINALQVSNNANYASVTSIELAYVTEDEALAASILTIESAFEAADLLLSADILTEQTARTTAISAAATDRTLIRSQFALADTALSASISASISTEASTRASADSAIAGTVTTLSSTVGGLSSTVSVQASTLADIEGNLAGKYSISVSGGGVGAFVSLEDGTTYGSVIELSAANIKLRADALDLGTATTFESTKDTFYTIAGEYRFRYGGPFGVSNTLLQWYGLNSVALNSETKTNGVFALATDGKVYFGNSALGASMSVTHSGVYVKVKIGTGTNNTGSITLTPTGGVAPYTYSHQLVKTANLNNISVTLNSPTSATFSISAGSQTPVKSVEYLVVSTITDAAGKSIQYTKGGGLFWES